MGPRQFAASIGHSFQVARKVETPIGRIRKQWGLCSASKKGGGAMESHVFFWRAIGLVYKIRVSEVWQKWETKHVPQTSEMVGVCRLEPPFFSRTSWPDGSSFNHWSWLPYCTRFCSVALWHVSTTKYRASLNATKLNMESNLSLYVACIMYSVYDVYMHMTLIHSDPSEFDLNRINDEHGQNTTFLVQALITFAPNAGLWGVNSLQAGWVIALNTLNTQQVMFWLFFECWPGHVESYWLVPCQHSPCTRRLRNYPHTHAWTVSWQCEIQQLKLL